MLDLIYNMVDGTSEYIDNLLDDCLIRLSQRVCVRNNGLVWRTKKSRQDGLVDQ